MVWRTELSCGTVALLQSTADKPPTGVILCQEHDQMVSIVATVRWDRHLADRLAERTTASTAYLVVAGEYDEFRVIACCVDERDAETRANRHNRSALATGHLMLPGDAARVEPVEFVPARTVERDPGPVSPSPWGDHPDPHDPDRDRMDDAELADHQAHEPELRS
jgi:hypothetical protein